jgi:hypothetical protein
MKRIFLFTSFISLCQILCIAQYDHRDYYDQIFNITTPNGSVVPDCYVLKSSVADIFLTPAQYAAQESDLYNNYNGAMRVDSSSLKYNCHGYAWHMAKGNDFVDGSVGKTWIGLTSGYSENVYWEDSSYIEVPEAYATIVSYHVSGDHSAIRLSSDWYVSKWGSGPLVRHHPESTLDNFNPTLEKKYYRRRPSISGASQINPMQNVSYFISNIPDGTTVTWSIAGNATIVSGQGTNTVVISACSGSSLTLTATLSSTISVTISKTISLSADSPGSLTVEPHMSYIRLSMTHPYATCYDWDLSDYVSSSIGTGTINCNSNSSINVTLTNGTSVGYVNVRPRTGICTNVPWSNTTVRYWKPEIDEENSTLNVTYGYPVYLCLEEPAPTDEGAVQYYWYYDNNLYYTTSEPYIMTTWWPCGEHLLKVKAVTNTKESEYDLVLFTGNCNSYSAAPWSAYPNPAANELIIDRNEEIRKMQVQVTDKKVVAANEKLTEITVLLYEKDRTSLVYSKIYPSDAHQIRINTSNLKDGIYFLNIVEGKEITSKQTIIVKH